MRQIPMSGEHCAGCGFVAPIIGRCRLYNDAELTGVEGVWLRLSKCLKDRPQVLKGEERKAIYQQGFDFCLDQWEDKP